MAKKQSKADRAAQQRQLQAEASRNREVRKRRELKQSIAMRLGGAVAVVALLAGAFLYYSRSGGSAVPVEAASASLGPWTENVPAGTTGSFHKEGQPLLQGKKPVLMFVGALYCPFCAAERWAVVKALSRFGTFSNLQTSGSQNGQFGVIPTFELLHAGYHSAYVSFDHKDVADRSGNALQSLTGQEQSLMNRYDPSGGIPFVSVDGYAMSGSGYSPSELQGTAFSAIHRQLQHNGSAAYVGDINGEANLLTAFLCRAMHDRDHTVCSRPVITGIQHSIL